MSIAVSILIERLDYLDQFGGGKIVNGAQIASAGIIAQIANHPDVEYLELFIPPLAMTPTARLAGYASKLLVPARQGQGRLRFYPHHSIPEVWADGHPRIIYTVDIGGALRDRYLRDKFAKGPMPLSYEVHALGAHYHSGVIASLARAPLNEFDTFLCASRSLRDALRKWLERTPNPGQGVAHRLDLLPKAIDHRGFHPAGADGKLKARQKLGWPEDKTIALFFGRVTPNDKADLLPLVQAFKEVASPKHALAICGIEEAKGYYTRLQAEGSELGERLILVPKPAMSKRPLYYQAADLFVFPGDTVQETFGLTVLEAMASGLPAIVSDWDGMRDTVEHGVTGLLVPTVMVPAAERVEWISPASSQFTDYLLLAQSVWVDTRELGSSLAALLENANERQRMGAAGRARVEQLYTWETYMATLLEIWNDQLTLAHAESDLGRAERAARAEELLFPTPYRDIFDHYATRVLNAQSDFVILTDYGKAVASKKAGIAFYDETLALLHPQVLTLLIEAISKLPQAKASEIVSSVSEQARLRPADVLFHLALLLKRGVCVLD